MTSYGSIDHIRIESSHETSPLIHRDNLPCLDAMGSIWSNFVFGWLGGLFRLGNAKLKLDGEDLATHPIPEDCMTDEIIERFEFAWGAEVYRAERQKETGRAWFPAPSLFLAFFRAFGVDFVVAGFLKLIHDLALFVGPQILYYLIIFLGDPDASFGQGFGLTVIVTAAQIVMSICLRQYFFKCYITGLRLRTSVLMAVFKKAMGMSTAERQLRSVGEITSLMSIDALRMQDLTTYLHAVWYSFLQIGLAIYFLWKLLGPSCLAGVGIIMAMIPLTKLLIDWMTAVQKTLLESRDARVETNSEVVSDINIVKMEAWEEPFQERIEGLRNTELRRLGWYLLGEGISVVLWTSTPAVVALATFATYVLSGNELDVATALTALVLFDIVRLPLFMLPRVINNIFEAAVSAMRIKSFLLSFEHVPVGPGDLDDTGILIEDASYQHAFETQKKPESEGLTWLCLKRINFECKAGELVAIVSSTGGGSSSFINAILGEVRELSGSTYANGSIAYCDKSPFILDDTLKINVVFGHTNQPVDEEKYQRALSCCGLREELELFPMGDMTVVGKSGVVLSDAQKARIALARAVYHDPDIVLLDDPLAAVDAKTSNSLFQNCIIDELLLGKSSRGIPKKRAIVFTTNSPRELRDPSVTKIVVLDEGEVVEAGTYEALTEDETEFAKVLATMTDTDKDSEGDSAEASAEPSDLVPVKPRKQEDPAKTNRLTGYFDKTVYSAWVRAAGGSWVPLVIFLAFTLVEAMLVVSRWWLTRWSLFADSTTQVGYLNAYALLNLALFGSVILRAALMITNSLRASKKIFARLLSVVIMAPMSFFDATPTKEIVDRFSRDMTAVDEQLLVSMREYIESLFIIFGSVVVISVVTPFFILFLIPIAVVYILQQRFFAVTYRELKRLDMAGRPPLYALLGEALDGVTTIRAYSAQISFAYRFEALLDRQQHAYYLTSAAKCWLALRLELVSTMIIGFACFSAVIERSILGGSLEFAGLAGLAISFALNITQDLNWSVRSASDLETQMVSVDNIARYCRVKTEAPRTNLMDSVVPEDWPSTGEIRFINVRLKYGPGSAPILNGLSAVIPGGSKVGVVGPEGAGKSTLMVALLRITELEAGVILVDGVDHRVLGLSKLRSSIAVIPQDPALFPGTVRRNLDPFDRHSDDMLYDVLERVGLHSQGAVSDKSPATAIQFLDEPVQDSGSNFSTGQRQLIVIARMLLTRASIVVLDEAGTGVDADMDAHIRAVVKKEFAKATCITIARRVNTIMDSDFAMLMDAGRVVEFGSPGSLLDKKGKFTEMVEAAAHEAASREAVFD